MYQYYLFMNEQHEMNNMKMNNSSGDTVLVM